jgi:hypothetical protein
VAFDEPDELDDPQPAVTAATAAASIAKMNNCLKRPITPLLVAFEKTAVSISVGARAR